MFLFFSGYTATEARIGLRACLNNIDQALTYIQERQQQRRKARKLGAAQRKVNSSVVATKSDKWVNPRNLHILSEMGFDKNVCVIALQKSDNDINQAVGDHMKWEERSILLTDSLYTGLAIAREPIGAAG